MAMSAVEEAYDAFRKYGTQSPWSVVGKKLKKEAAPLVKQASVRMSAVDQVRNSLAPTIGQQYDKGISLAKNVISRAINTPVVPLVRATTPANLATTSQRLGSAMQRVNVPTIPLPDRKLPSGISTKQIIQNAFPITQVSEQINNYAQSYGRTLTNPTKNPVETALNVAPMFMGSVKPLQGSKVKTATQLVEEKLGSFAPSELRKARPGSYTNVTAIDNPAIKGESGMTGLREAMKQKLLTWKQKYSPKVNQEVQKAVKDEFNPQTPVTKKINILDYVRTPDRVLNKIGLGNEAKQLRVQYEKYLDELPQELNRIEAWSKRVGPESNEKIFRHLDGERITLNVPEQEVADEIRTYLRMWASRLKLPQEKRVSDYITRLYEKGAIEQDFPEEIAKMISGKIPKDVYNPFLQKRTGTRIDYLRDTWGALEAYVKRGTRQYNLAPALEAIEKKSPDLELSQINYIKNLTERINMRPTEVDTLIDNAVKSSPIGYKLGSRPVTAATRTVRQQVFRGTLGLNVSTALRNLTQAANTYAKLGEKYTAKGYLQLAKNWNSGELEKVGVLRDSMLQDKRLTAIKKTIDSVDKGLFYLFEKAEKINRGSAYFGAKAKALSEGMSEGHAIDYAKKIVRDTQFQFGSIDTPLGLQGDIVKTMTQFMSYPIKQTEFLGEMLKNKEWAGLIRWIGSTLVMGKALKDTFGLDIDIIPFQGILQGETRFGDTPTIKAGRFALQYAFGDEEAKQEAGKELVKTAKTFIPGGVQLGKTAEAVGAMNEGASFTPTGKFRFEVKPSLKTAIFGIWSTKEAQEYLKDKGIIGSLSPEQQAAKEFKKQEASVKSQEDRMAAKLYLELKNASPADRKQILAGWKQQGLLTKELQDGIKRYGEKELEKKDTKFASAVRGIQSNEGKAKFIRMYLSKTVKERRAGYLKELKAANLMTPGVITEMNKQAQRE